MRPRRQFDRAAADLMRRQGADGVVAGPLATRGKMERKPGDGGDDGSGNSERIPQISDIRL